MTLSKLNSPKSDKTCQLVTLGCKVNQYETQLVKEALEKNGYREASESETADLCVVNTCTVTATGDAKGRKLIRQLSKNNPGTKILVMGCYATRDPKTVSELPGVFEVVTDKRELPDILERHGIVDMPTGISEFEGRKRAYVKVQDGCILRCTYCIIPSVRPGLQSRSPQDIEEEVRRLVGNGFKEIVLTGIHVGHFGVDTTRGKSGKAPFRLWHLFRKLDQIPGDWRMRLSSVETAEINDDFISAAADCEHLCPQFHPSLQSGSDTVLQRMKRRYYVSRFLEKLQMMRERLNHPAFTTDVIVGFPGETDAEFEETLRTCQEAAFMKIHIFPFSARKGTPAATYENQVSPEIRQERCQQLAELERKLAQNFYHTLIDRNLQVLIERVCTELPGWVRGTDRWYAPVICRGTKADLGNFVNVRGVRDHHDYLEADRISP
ncbi:tRNA (N(6)-L-threonylcarbamoyladenosine(37)-C(2))-methylthiotransferase MtaB [uncultured Gimesia sp.]|jgi:threonylcarbamoyladenosine tRNA methylthiotransferase MtaB|uniref:tRNA (N(6)-L-threonylcarbamoyladenosine(37)-C(2))- methylthiotransferase MtaB n=1 Tax=uncultured Gimesia sp. TaxID=1678688 RepID=UPI00261F7F9C|nr:tRNA (N(6)-L-threonylcarbamoyladenosine(37)-C(2))-methylthiotransferase MtaB [uncultured Gimesia sp.]